MAKLKGTALIILIGVICYLCTLFLEPIYTRLWLQFVYAYVPVLTTEVFGYILLGLSVAFLVAFALTKPKRHPLQRWLFFFLFLFTLIMALPLALPTWYDSMWRF